MRCAVITVKVGTTSVFNTGTDRMEHYEIIKKNVADLDPMSTMGGSPRSIIKGKCIRGKSMSIKQYSYIPVS